MSRWSPQPAPDEPDGLILFDGVCVFCSRWVRFVIDPALAVSTGLTTASYDDLAALRAFAEAVDVITYEFENIPTAALDLLESLRPTASEW